jgi:hypothetical protein
MMILKLICEFLVYPDILQIFYNKLNKKHDVEQNESTKKRVKTTSIGKKMKQNFANSGNSPKKFLKTPSMNTFKKIETYETTLETNSPTNKKRHSVVVASKISFDLKPFTTSEKLARLCCLKTERYNKRIQQLNEVEKMFQKKLSMEHITNLSRKVKLFEVILFEDHQRNLMKYIELPKREKVASNFLNDYNELKQQVNDGKVFINESLKFYLKK